MKKFLIFLLLNILWSMEVNAFPVDGKPTHIGYEDFKVLNENTCIAYGAIERYEAWQFPHPDSYISGRVYCNVTKAEDGYFRRNVFDCNNQKGMWECDLINTEMKYIFSPPINFIFLSSKYLNDKESLEVIDKLVLNSSDSAIYREARCSVDNKTRDNKNLYVVECNHKKYVEILKTCENSSCVWTIVSAGNIFN